MFMKLEILWGLSLIFLPLAGAETGVYRSGEKQVQLIELYSSESCSSCPPADEWISSLKNKAGLYKSFIPVVFHVDYWNHLDWKDPFSSHEMTQRQEALSQQEPKHGVYTPGFLINGKEWRGKNIPESSIPSQINLILKKEPQFNFSTQVIFNKEEYKNKKYILRLAILGMNIRTHILAGENKGRDLIHDFIILDWKSQELDSHGKNKFHFNKPQQNSSLVVVAWIEEKGNLSPLQATGGAL
jgi:hypothetical protein